MHRYHETNFEGSDSLARRMRSFVGLGLMLLCAGLLISGCATDNRRAVATKISASAEITAIYRVSRLSDEIKMRVMALEPEHVTEREVTDLLAQLPAPQIICINGGILPIKSGMNSFAQFLIGMGYPESSVRNPGDGSYAYGYYDPSDKIAGAIAWYYERDGLRPMVVGHSQGGIAAIRVLHRLSGNTAQTLAVWNPITQSEEGRYAITDPLTGIDRPVVGLQVSYATAAVAGGLARALPNEWDMNGKLRKIPDSVEEFTGFSKGLDILGGDFFGYGPANDYRPVGSAKVRNVRLPSASSHSAIPHTKSLLGDPEVLDWINHYRPSTEDDTESRSTPEFWRTNARIIWAADVWYSIKKHWVMELQRLIHAQSAAKAEHRVDANVSDFSSCSPGELSAQSRQ